MAEKALKVIINSLLLLMLVGVIALPALSSGLLLVNKNIRVLSSQSARPENGYPEKPLPKPVKVKTVIIKEAPVNRIVIPDGHLDPQTSPSVRTPGN